MSEGGVDRTFKERNIKNMKRLNIIITILTLIGLLVGGAVMAKPLFEVKNFNKAEHVQDEIIVKFKGDREHFRVIKVPKGRIGEKIGEYLKKRDIEYAEPNYIAHAFMVPNDEYYGYQWHMDNSEYGGINMEIAWDVSTGSGVTVAIVDTGIAYEDYGRFYKKAPDLANTCFVAGYDFVNNDSHPNDDSSPGHGTHVAGTVAQSTNNNLGVAGIAFNACLMPVKVLNSSGSGTYADVADGIYWAVDHGAQVINLSLGGSSDSQTLKDAVAYAYNNGVTVVAAAGNDNSSTISYPAAYDDYVIAVGATQYDETLAPYSNYGASLDLVAPGGNLDLDQNNDGYGDGVLQQTFERKGWRTTWGYYFMQGTSMATPHVAGIAVLVLANGNTTTVDEVRSALQETTEDLGAAGFDETYGWGLVDAYAALGWTSAPVTPECTVDADCDDGLYCNGVETCQSGDCQVGAPIDCSSLNDQCNIGTCDEATDSCVAQPVNEGLACDDGLFCNVGETCQSGVCTGGSTRDCGDEEPCTIDSCDEDLDVCVSTWPACGLEDGCCGPECDYAIDNDCSAVEPALCWSGGNGYLYRRNGQAKKFCKCAQGDYGYNKYKYSRGRKTVYKYLDTGNNENWEVSSISSYISVYEVICTDGVAYPTNKDYYWPK